MIVNKEHGLKGWIKLWRKETTNPLFFEGPFDKWHAYIDLCMLADSEGTVETTLKALKIRWSWTSIKKVRAYMGTISELDLGTVEGIPKKGIVIRLNTDFLASQKNKKGTVKGTVKGTISSDKEESSKEDRGTKSPPNSTSALSKKELYRLLNEENEDE